MSRLFLKRARDRRPLPQAVTMGSELREVCRVHTVSRIDTDHRCNLLQSFELTQYLKNILLIKRHTIFFAKNNIKY